MSVDVSCVDVEFRLPAAGGSKRSKTFWIKRYENLFDTKDTKTLLDPKDTKTFWRTGVHVAAPLPSSERAILSP